MAPKPKPSGVMVKAIQAMAGGVEPHPPKWEIMGNKSSSGSPKLYSACQFQAAMLSGDSWPP